MTSASIDPCVFYSNPRSASELSSICRVFHTQQEAFTYFDSLVITNSIKIYTYETISGKRKFLVSHEDSFIDKYIDSDMLRNRHVYEIIREHYPCRLYFDIEYAAAVNPDVDGKAVVAKWIQLVAWKCYELFHLVIGPECFIELDSSTSEKFSKHVTAILKTAQDEPEMLFFNNSHVGRFVLGILTNISIETYVDGNTQRLPTTPFEELWVLTKDGRKTCIVDCSVYTKNRSFRIYQSSKFGKSATLKISSDPAFELMNQTLIKPCTGCLETRQSHYKRVLRLTYVVPYRSSPKACDTNQLSRNGVIAVDGAKYIVVEGASQGSSSVEKPACVARIQSRGCEPSPFADIDVVVRGLACKGGVQGEIRAWSWLQNWMVYQIDKNKWCDNVGRPHKSNGIMFNVDLVNGIAYQTCWDHDCKGYRSTGTALSSHVVSKSKEELELLFAVYECSTDGTI